MIAIRSAKVSARGHSKGHGSSRSREWARGLTKSPQKWVGKRRSQMYRSSGSVPYVIYFGFPFRPLQAAKEKRCLTPRSQSWRRWRSSGDFTSYCYGPRMGQGRQPPSTSPSLIEAGRLCDDVEPVEMRKVVEAQAVGTLGVFL